MTKRLQLILLALLCAVLPSLAQHRVQGIELPPEASAPDMTPPKKAAGYDLDKIKTWVGEGQNRCGIIIHFGGNTIIVGYRWDGQKNGLQALIDIAAKDSRFYLLHKPAIFGFGWDYNQDGKFEVVNKSNPERKLDFPESHVIEWNSYDDLAWQAADPEDLWYSAWMGGYWRYYTKDPGQDSFVYSQVGAGGRWLVDGCWDEWGGQGSSTIYDGNPYVEPMPTEDTPREFTVNGVNYKAFEPITAKRIMVVKGDYSGSITIPERVEYQNLTFRVVEIAEDAFQGSSVTDVNIPSSLKEIKDKTFAGCSSLRTINLKAVESIGLGAFSGCSKLESLSFSSNIHTVQPGIFNGCTALRSLAFCSSTPAELSSDAFENEVYENAVVTTPFGLKSFYSLTPGWSAFKNFAEDSAMLPDVGCELIVDGVKYKFSNLRKLNENELVDGIVNEGYLSVIGYISELIGEKAVIPADYIVGDTRLEIISVADKAFVDAPCKEFDFQGTKLIIGKEAFSGCVNLEKIDFSRFFSLGKEAFKNCTSLKEGVVRNSNVAVFTGCTALEKVTLSTVVPFAGCPNLREVYLDNTTFTKDSKVVLYFEPEVFENATLYVPQYGAEVCRQTEVLKEFKNIVERDDIKADANSSFAHDGLIYKVKKGDDEEYLSLEGGYASLVAENVFVPERLTISGVSYPVREINISSSYADLPYKTISFPSTVRYVTACLSGSNNIEEIVFRDCEPIALGKIQISSASNLKTVRLPKGLTEVEALRVFDCPKFEGFDFPTTLKKIGTYYWDSCKGIVSMELPDIEVGTTTLRSMDFTTLHIPDSYTEAPQLSSCRNLVSVTGMNNVKKIGAYAFYGCTKLKEINLSQVEEIEYSAFQNCSSLPKVLDLPRLKKFSSGKDNKTSYDFAVFKGTEIEVLNAPMLDSICTSVFSKVTTLREVNAPNLKHIGDYAFYQCKGLEKFTFENVEYIGQRAFMSASKLTGEITLPKVRSIGKWAFTACPITKLSLPVCEIVSGFRLCLILTEVYMPAAVEIGEDAFNGCNALDFEILDLPNIRKIGKGAFSGCNVKEAYLPNCEEVDGFMGITTLTKISCPKAKIIHDLTGCTALAELDWMQAEELYSLSNTALKFPETVVLPNAKRLNDELFGELFTTGNQYGIKTLIAPSVEFMCRPITGLTDLENFVVGPNFNSFKVYVIQNCPNATVWMTASPMAFDARNTFVYLNINQLYVLTGRKDEFIDFKYYNATVSGDHYMYPYKELIDKKGLVIKELTPKALTLNQEEVASVDIDCAELTMTGTYGYEEESELTIPELFLEENAKWAAKKFKPVLQWAVKGNESSPRMAVAKVGDDGIFRVNLSGLQDGTEYSYRWMLDDAPLQDEWGTFTTTAWPADLDYTKGHFVLNEDWYGTDNSTLSFFSETNDRLYWRAFRHANDGNKLGQTAQFGTVFADKLLIMNKQAGESSGILTVADAKTLKQLGAVSFGTADGRAVVGYTPEKAFVSTSNGVYPVDLSAMTAGEKIEGTEGSSDVYAAQTGDMVIAGERLYVTAMGKGVYVIDPATDKLITTIAMPDVQSVFTTASGKLYAANDVRESQFVEIDPETYSLTAKGFDNEGRVIPFSWGTWRKFPLVADFTDETVYFVEQTSEYNGLDASAYSVASYDFATDTYTPAVISAESLSETSEDGTVQQHYIYGTGIGMEAASGNLTLYTCPGHKVVNGKAEGSWTYNNWSERTYSRDEQGAWTQVKVLAMPEYYWFPAMLMNTDRFAPVLAEQVADDISLETYIDKEEDADESIEIDLTGKATDADAHNADNAIRYEVTVADGEICKVERIDATRFRVTPKAGGETTLSAVAQSNGVQSAPATIAVAVTRKINEVAKPEITVADGENGVAVVTMACATDNARIRYTLDGTEPTAESALYTEPIILDKTTTVKAVATLYGTDSEVAELEVIPACVGIDYIMIEGNRIPSDAELYTIDGVRVPLRENLAKGIYVARFNGKSLKLIVE